MALLNQPGMYNGSAPLNPLPYVNIALQSRARKEARNAAIDQYYQKLPDTINDKGVRDQEIPLINDFKGKIFEYGLKNKEALRNPRLDNGAAQLGLQKMIRDAHSVARLSQDAAKDDLEIGKIRLTKGNEWLADDEEFIKEHDLHNLPVTDPNFKKVDINKVLSGRPFDLSKTIKKFADIKMSDGTPEYSPHPTDKLQEIETIRPKWGDGAPEAIYQRAVSELHNNRGFEKELKKLKPEEIALLDDVSKKTFGHNIREDFAEEDIAAAYMANSLSSKGTRQKAVPNKTAISDKKRAEGMADWKLKEGIRQANREKLFGMREAAKDAGEEVYDLWVENHIDRLGKDAAVSTNKVNFSKGGVNVVENSIPVDAFTAKSFTRDGLSPDRITVTKDGTYRPIFYQRDKDGNKKLATDGQVLVNESLSVPISKDQFKLLLGGKAGVKQLNKEMTVPTNTTTGKPKKKVW